MFKFKNLTFARKILSFSIISTILIGVILISFSYFLQSKILLESLKNETNEITKSWVKELKPENIEMARKEKDYNGPEEKKLTEQFDLLSKYNPNVAQGYIFGTELKDGNKTSIIAVPSHIVKALKDAGLKVGDMYEQPAEIAKSVQVMMKTKETTFSNVYKDDLGVWITILYPIKDNNGEVSSYFGIDVDASMVSKGQKELLVYSSIALLIFLMIIISIQYVIIRKTLSPIKELVQGIDKVSEGNFDIELKAGNDELGLVNAKFNVMKNQIKEMILKVKETSYKIDGFSKELLLVTDKSAEHAVKITKEIQEMASGIETQKHSTVESASAMTEIAAGIQTIANNASNVSSSAFSMENKSNQGNDVIKRVIEQMKLIADAVKNTSSVIKVLDERSKEIGNIMEVITQISNQTNLLALNAAIEAARAGENGKGFAVVADEVRKLAEQSQKSAEQIVKLVQVIQNETTNTVNSMNKGNKEVEIGMEIVKQTGDLFLEILNTTKEVASEIQDVSSSSQQISATTEEITASVTDLTSIAKQTSSTSHNIANNVEAQQASMESVAETSKQLSCMSEELQKLISKFQI